MFRNILTSSPNLLLYETAAVAHLPGGLMQSGRGGRISVLIQGHRCIIAQALPNTICSAQLKVTHFKLLRLLIPLRLA